jgi:hypothetical protein
LFHFRFASDFYVSHQCETSEKITFFGIEAKKISLPFRYKAKMTAHPNNARFVSALWATAQDVVYHSLGP